MRILVCGSRNWGIPQDNSVAAIELASRQRVVLAYWLRDTLDPDDVVIEGEAKGADTFAREAAEALGIAVERYPADWKQYGRAAGPIRNKQMLVEGKPDLVLAFCEDLSTSRGTANMVKQATQHGIHTMVISHDG